MKHSKKCKACGHDCHCTTVDARGRQYCDKAPKGDCSCKSCKCMQKD